MEMNVTDGATGQVLQDTAGQALQDAALQKPENRKNQALKNAAEVLCYVALTLLLCIFLQKLTEPKYMSHPYEGAMMAEYYETETSHDVIFLGDCEFYETISPIELWEGYGISSYVRGSPQQLIWQSYYVLKDTLKHETPQVVVFNAMEMKIGETQKEEYTRLTLDGLKNLNYRLAAAKVSLKGDEDSLISYAIPLLRYHSRWSSLTEDDWKYLTGRELISYQGYLMQTGVEPQTDDYFEQPLFDYTLPERCWEYLDKIAELCEENGITLVLFKAPTKSWQYPWYDAWEQQIDEYAAEHGILYVNGLEYVDEMGLDMQTDTYDKGVHLNVYGAEKCSDFLGDVLTSLGVPDRRSDSELAAAWEPICERYHEAKGE